METTDIYIYISQNYSYIYTVKTLKIVKNLILTINIEFIIFIRCQVNLSNNNNSNISS